MTARRDRAGRAASDKSAVILDDTHFPVVAEDLRAQLLWLVEREVPEVLASLEAVVAPAFADAWTDPAALEAAVAGPAVERWAHAAWRIPDEKPIPAWLRVAAGVTLARWGDPTYRGRRWGEINLIFAHLLPPLALEFRPWRPLAETAEAYVAGVRAEAARAAEDYIAAMRAAAEPRGWRPAGRRRARDRHLRWLVRYQLNGESFRQIAESGPSSDGHHQKVADAIKALADRLELPLRAPSQGGRPRAAPSRSA